MFDTLCTQFFMFKSSTVLLCLFYTAHLGVWRRAPLARAAASAATVRTDAGAGEQARAALANSGAWSGTAKGDSIDELQPACAALASGVLVSGGGPRVPLRVQKGGGC